MQLANKKVLVTGADGFIGSHLVESLLEEGCNVRALVYYNSFNNWGWLDTFSQNQLDAIEVIPGDVRDPNGMRKAVKGCDLVFHLAALIGIPYSYHAPLSYLRTNVEGTLNVMQGALQAGVSLLVQTSTSEVYGTAQYVPMDEEHPLQGQSPYAASKIGADKMAEAFHRSFGLPVVTLRPFNTFGPRQSSRAVVPTIITQALTQPEVKLGNWDTTRDFNYVSYIVEAFVLAAEAQRAVGQVINVGTGQEIAIGDLAEKILKLTGTSVPVMKDANRVRPDASEVARLCADNRKARDLLGWRPRHSLDEGLTRTVDWVSRNIERYRVGAYAL
jgi:NAD dependent epimerase/dehydratase